MRWGCQAPTSSEWQSWDCNYISPVFVTKYLNLGNFTESFILAHGSGPRSGVMFGDSLLTGRVQ
jgi:hypothetical protein